MLGRLVLDALRKIAKERVGEIRDHDADEAAPAIDERARGHIRDVTHLVRQRRDLLAGRGLDARTVLQRPRHRGRVHFRSARDVFNRHALRLKGSVRHRRSSLPDRAKTEYAARPASIGTSLRS